MVFFVSFAAVNVVVVVVVLDAVFLSFSFFINKLKKRFSFKNAFLLFSSLKSCNSFISFNMGVFFFLIFLFLLFVCFHEGGEING